MIVDPNALVARMSYEDKERILANLIAVAFKSPPGESTKVDLDKPTEATIAEEIRSELVEEEEEEEEDRDRRRGLYGPEYPGEVF